MKVRVLKKLPNGVEVKDLESGEIIKYPNHFFDKRRKLGIIEVENLELIRQAV